MPEHLQGTTWALLDGEYLPLPNNAVIVGPIYIRVNDYGYDEEKDYYLFAVQLSQSYDFCGDSGKFEDYVMKGTPSPELKRLL